MPAVNRCRAPQSRYVDLSSQYQQYARDVPENGFPTFLESLMFEAAEVNAATQSSRVRVEYRGHANTRSD